MPGNSEGRKVIRVDCALCGKTLAVRDNLAGKLIRCAPCGAVLRTPGPAPPAGVVAGSPRSGAGSNGQPAGLRPSPVILGAGCVIILIGIFGAFLNSGSRQGEGNPYDHSLPAGTARDALNDAASVFIGHHSREEIQRKMDLAMRAWGSIHGDNEHYARVASGLLALRKETGFAEVDILDTMIDFTGLAETIGADKAKDERQQAFPAGAALACQMLKQGHVPKRH